MCVGVPFLSPAPCTAIYLLIEWMLSRVRDTTPVFHFTRSDSAGPNQSPTLERWTTRTATTRSRPDSDRRGRMAHVEVGDELVELFQVVHQIRLGLLLPTPHTHPPSASAVRHTTRPPPRAAPSPPPPARASNIASASSLCALCVVPSPHALT
jgi:hypothetical protein